VQQVHGESQGKQLDLEPSTPYPGSTSAPGNTATSTLHPGNTSDNVIYVDASSPYPGGGGVSMGNPGTSLTANLPYPWGTSTSGNQGFPTHTTPTNPNPNFQQLYYQIMVDGPLIGLIPYLQIR
jgi:hypothetical protein